MSLITIENDVPASVDYVSARNHDLGQEFVKTVVAKLSVLVSSGIDGIAALFTNNREGVINFGLPSEELNGELFFLFLFGPCPVNHRKTVAFIAVNFTANKVYDFTQNIVYDR
ncbi:hypothetical protein D9M68_18130 [compost metagenome]